ncbi:PKD domain-containing protein [bacterium]|nr:PKD domain-containing protein [bacterium]MCI0605625.1 PKD domain-containing protein [bacterium]
MKRGVIFALGLFLLILHVACNNDSVTGPTLLPPTIASITPNRVSRGERVVGTIVGTNFNGASQVFLGNEVTVEGFAVLNPTTIEVRFTVNTNASSGSRPVQVTTSVGTGTAGNLLQVINNRSPITRFTVFPDQGATNTIYTFDGTISTDPDGQIVSYQWDFGDGKTGIGAVATHKFKSTGTFEVTMKIVDNDDATGTATQPLTVFGGTGPTAKFVIQPKTGDVNTTYTFSAANSSDSDGSIVRYSWDFGNGDTATGETTTVHFGKAGIFGVTLVVTDNDGLQSSERKDVIVGAFDQAKATEEIRAVVREFFRRYSQLDKLTAEQIVINWSDSPGCNGKAHEINIIEGQQQVIVKTQATPGFIEVSFTTTAKAHAIAPADFAWTEIDGNSYTGFATHDFQMIFESGKWQVCNFVLI